jgi:hypothetical protein
MEILVYMIASSPRFWTFVLIHLTLYYINIQMDSRWICKIYVTVETDSIEVLFESKIISITCWNDAFWVLTNSWDIYFAFHYKCFDFCFSLTLSQPLICAWLMQEQDGGLRDKPGKRRDHYHSCYCLSGLSLCQYSWSKRPDSPPLPKVVMGPYSNLLEPIHPLFNVVLDRYREAREFFAGLWFATRF